MANLKLFEVSLFDRRYFMYRGDGSDNALEEDILLQDVSDFQANEKDVMNSVQGGCKVPSREENYRMENPIMDRLTDIRVDPTYFFQESILTEALHDTPTFEVP